MQNYELTYLISPELSEKEAIKFGKKIEELVKKNGQVVKSTLPRKISLAYPVQKKKEAFLVTLELKKEPSEIENLKKEIEKEKNVLRFLLIKKKKIKTETEKPKEIKEKLPEDFLPAGVSVETGTKKEAKQRKSQIKENEEKLDAILKT